MSDDSFVPVPKPGELTIEVAPAYWQRLNTEETADAMARLVPWVNWIVHRYQLDTRTIPTCWQDHGAHIEELAALRTAWNKAYQGDSQGKPALEWHAAFDHALQRLTDWTSRTGCRNGEHRVQGPRPSL